MRVLINWFEELAKISTILIYAGLGFIGIVVIIVIICIIATIIKDRKNKK